MISPDLDAILNQAWPKAHVLLDFLERELPAGFALRLDKKPGKPAMMEIANTSLMLPRDRKSRKPKP